MVSTKVFFKDTKTGMPKEVFIKSEDNSADSFYKALRGVAAKCVVLNPTLHLNERFTLADVCQLAPDYLFRHHDLTKYEFEIPENRKVDWDNQTDFPLLSSDDIQMILSYPDCYRVMTDSICQKAFGKG